MFFQQLLVPICACLLGMTSDICFITFRVFSQEGNVFCVCWCVFLFLCVFIGILVFWVSVFGYIAKYFGMVLAKL
jgi:hypothetical protein